MAPLPWTAHGNSNHATTRTYEAKAHFLLHSWYLTGFHRAKDQLLGWVRSWLYNELGVTAVVEHGEIYDEDFSIALLLAMVIAPNTFAQFPPPYYAMGSNNYQHASTVEEGVAQGRADVIRSTGAANLMNSEAADRKFDFPQS